MLVSNDYRNQLFAHVECESDVALRGRSFIEGCPDFSDLGVADFGLGVTSVQLQANGVSFVVGLGHPFKIADHIVGFDAIDVIDLFKVEGVRDERNSNKSMDKTSDGLSISGKGDVNVFCFGSWIATGAGTNDLSLSDDLSAILSDDDSVDTADSTDVADFVESFKSSYGSPFFINHLGVLLQEGAHSIVLSSTTQGGHQCRFH